MPTPPRLATWLLTRRLPPDLREDIVGDLDEDFDDRTQTLSAAGARRWYWRRALQLAWSVTPRALETSILPPMARHRGADAFWRDWRLAARRLRRQPLVTALAVLALAGSIGIVSATWMLLDATLLHPIPANHADRVVLAGTTQVLQPGRGPALNLGFAWPSASTMLASGVFADAAVSGSWDAQQDDGDQPKTVRLAVVSTGFLHVLGIAVDGGRDFTGGDDQPGAPLVAIVSHQFIRTWMHDDDQVVGRPISLNGRAVTIVGIAPSAFRGLDLSDPPAVMVPVSTAGALMGRAAYGTSLASLPIGWRVVGRLRDNDAIDGAQARLSAVLRDLRNQRVTLLPIEDGTLPEKARDAMKSFVRLLATAVGLLLVIGSLTVGMLLLIRTEARRGEFSMCLALGASRFGLARGVFFESALLAAFGSLLSLPAAMAAYGALGTVQLPGGVSLGRTRLTFDLTTLGIIAASGVAATAVIAAVGVLFGIPRSLRDVGVARVGSTPRLANRRARAVLIAGQAALTLVLGTGATLLARSLAAAMHVNPGFDTAHLITGDVGLVAYRYTPNDATPVFNELFARLSANPTIRSVSFASAPAAMGAGGSLVVDGVARTFPTLVTERQVDDHFFPTVGLPIVVGRNFTSVDDNRAPIVIIVSESLGRLIANGGNAVGHTVRAFHGTIDRSFPVMTIVGIVPDVITSVSHLEPLVMYLPLAQDFAAPSWWRELMVRPSRGISTAETEIAATVRQLGASMQPGPQVLIETMDEHISGQMGPQQLGATVLGGLGTLALLLTMLGTYVLAESMAVVRRREMGIRAALGARRFDLGAIVVREAGWFLGIGLAIGLFAVWAEAATIRAFLLHVEPLDPLSVMGTAAVILGVGAFVSLRPALTASRVDTARILRDE